MNTLWSKRRKFPTLWLAVLVSTAVGALCDDDGNGVSCEARRKSVVAADSGQRREAPMVRRRSDRAFRPTGRIPYRGWLEDFRKKHPDEYSELMRLKEENPEEFRRRLSELARERMRQRWKPKMQPEERRCLELSEKYHKAKSPEEKQKILAELRKAVEAAFDARIQERLRWVDAMEQKLKQIRGQIQERQANKDKICEARVEELTRDPKYRWNW